MEPAPAGRSRRRFLQAGAAGFGGLMLGFRLGPAAAGTGAGYVLRPNAFIAIAPDGGVTFQIPQEEMGQGILTALSQLIADELDVAIERVTALAAPPDDALYGAPGFGRMGTGGSRSIRNFYTPLRRVGASGRAMLVAAAARRWQVMPRSLRTAAGEVIDDAHGRRLGYGALAAEAALLPAPQRVVLKADRDLRLIGRSVKRLDAPAKVNGTAQYGIDLRMDGLRIAILAAAPVAGGRVGHVDASRFRALPGLQLVVLDDLVAVVGPHFWAARTGLQALGIVWDDGPEGQVDSAVLWQDLRRAGAGAGAVAVSRGDVGRAGGDRVDVAYELPFLAHAAMEPLNFTVHVRGGGCEMWGGSQVQTAARAAAARVLGVRPDKVIFHNRMLGGAFGRRLDVDMVVKAVRIAREVAGPVKVIWTREEDITQDFYRPAYRNVMSAWLHDGRVTGWRHRIAAGSVAARMSGRGLAGGLDRGALENIYGVPNFHVDYAEARPRGIRVGYWRGVAPNNNVFATECLMDELALRAGQDPASFRLAHLGGARRLAGVLRLAARAAGWGGALPARSGRGVALQFAFGTCIATVAEVDVVADGLVRVRRMTAAIDAGRVVNPDLVRAQIEGGLVFGLTAALFGEITVKGGRVQQRNFNDYRMLRMDAAPDIRLHLVASTEPPGGIGEPGVTAAAPALVNAVAAATGIRLRRLPVDRAVLAGRA